MTYILPTKFPSSQRTHCTPPMPSHTPHTKQKSSTHLCKHDGKVINLAASPNQSCPVVQDSKSKCGKREFLYDGFSSAEGIARGQKAAASTAPGALYTNNCLEMQSHLQGARRRLLISINEGNMKPNHYLQYLLPVAGGTNPIEHKTQCPKGSGFRQPRPRRRVIYDGSPFLRHVKPKLGRAPSTTCFVFDVNYNSIRATCEKNHQDHQSWK